MAPKCKKLYNQNYKEIFMHCARTASHFRDDKFPPEDSSICKRGCNDFGPIKWMRVKVI